MAFTIEDLRDLLQLLRQHPEWRDAVRREVLAEDLLELPAIVRRLAEAQERTAGEIDRLTEAQQRMAGQIDRLVAEMGADSRRRAARRPPRQPGRLAVRAAIQRPGASHRDRAAPAAGRPGRAGARPRRR